MSLDRTTEELGGEERREGGGNVRIGWKGEGKDKCVESQCAGILSSSLSPSLSFIFPPFFHPFSLASSSLTEPH